MSAETAVLPARPAFARRARVTDLVAAEWLKLWSPWYTAAASAAVVVLSVVIAQHDPKPVVFDAPAWLLMMLAAGLLGAQTVVTEHATGLVRSTLTAVPDRRRLVAAKAAVVVGVTAALALVLASADIVNSRPTTAGSATPGQIAACGALGPVCGLAGMAVATLARHLATTAAGVCVVLGALPLFLQPKQNRWEHDVSNALPYYSWSRLASGSGTMTVPVAWGTLAAWAVASFLITVIILDRRDV
ncbi:hypothetical protein DN069_17690 [Streptacidiphilus pinicola]|uniref:ABC transporter permease n=1 Tax=Streptacidiphilus pinicola TaxID=2219663 RepID=A0A2X0KBB8_9ACTN|nr:hypothetical protein [Streptacidiphilus pinicola]RAG84320.1 hypothetical protein DN069_17690 [Streptacidiphilus pinicola]